MEQQFQLKHYGKLNLFEQNQMTAEERGWYMKRLEKEFKDKKEQEEAQMRNVRKPSTPSKPSMPSIPRK
jgi:hypothetical protein